LFYFNILERTRSKTYFGAVTTGRLRLPVGNQRFPTADKKSELFILINSFRGAAAAPRNFRRKFHPNQNTKKRSSPFIESK